MTSLSSMFRAVIVVVLAGTTMATAQSCPCDYDSNGRVDSSDLGQMLAKWNTSDSGFDLDGNGNVDAGDLGLLIAVWGTCPDVEYCHAGSAKVLSTWSGAAEDAEIQGLVVGHPDEPTTSVGRICGTQGFHGRSAFGSLVFFEYYEVAGDTPYDVYYAIMDGCCLVINGKPFAAYTTWELEVESGCIEFSSSDQTSFGVVDVRFIYTIRLPVWNPPADAIPEDVANWEEVVRLLTEHELEHVAIGEAYRNNLLWEAIGIDGSGFTRSVSGLHCPLYYGGSVIPGTDLEASSFENDAIQWLYDGPTFDSMNEAQRQLDDDTDHGDVWAPL